VIFKPYHSVAIRRKTASEIVKLMRQKIEPQKFSRRVHHTQRPRDKSFAFKLNA